MNRRRILSLTLPIILIIAGVIPAGQPSSAQIDPAPCGYVDGFAFPVDGIDVERTDFGIYRPRFGGLHTGIDVAFQQLGDPVRAAARGRVTYSNTEGWDTEKGVVVIQHTFPDGKQVNTLYGHMEELNGYKFPAMDQCVEQGDIIGAIGAPSRGSPHLHYEVRTRYRHEGGPGYTQVNPLELGWLHPVDFTYLARVWVNPAHRGHFSLLEAPTLPPLLLANNTYVITHSSHLEGLTADGQLLWKFDTLGSVTGVLELPDGRILAATSSNQVLVLNNGSYSVLWQTPKKFVTPPILFGGVPVFATADNTLMALTADGVLLWETPPLAGRAQRWAISGDRLAVATQNNELWIVDVAGTVIGHIPFSTLPIPSGAANGEFTVLNGSTISRLNRDLILMPLVDMGVVFTPNAQLIGAANGAVYVYTGEGRALYAYEPDGALRWIAYMPGSHLRPPLLRIGAGALLYVLTTDGQLLAYATEDGRLIAQLPLYNGGINGTSAARWLDVRPDDTVRYSGGFLSVVTLDGTELLGTP